MTPDNTETKNAQGEVSEEQAQIDAWVVKLREFLGANPEAGLQPVLRFTETGIQPDMKVVLAEVTETEDEQTKPDEADAGDSEESTEGSDEASGEDGPAEASNTEG